MLKAMRCRDQAIMFPSNLLLLLLLSKVQSSLFPIYPYPILSLFILSTFEGYGISNEVGVPSFYENNVFPDQLFNIFSCFGEVLRVKIM